MGKDDSYWLDKNVLVTGAGGFIASHLVEHLATQGANIKAFVRYNSRADIGLLADLHPSTRESVEILFGDLRDLTAVQEALNGVDLVYHLGALIAIPYSYQHPAEVVETNVMGTLNILLAAKQHPIDRIIHTSTSEVYGTALYVPMDENHPLQGQSPYSASKIGADKIVESFHLSYDIPVVTVRPFNTYGPRQSTRAVIPTIITQALTQDIIRLGNVDSSRDLTYVSDTVAGFVRAAKAPGVEGQTINLGTGSEITIRQIADTVIDLVDKDLQIEIDQERMRPEKSEVQRLFSDNKKASQMLGWQPVVDLREGLTRSIDWYQTHLGRFSIGKYQI